MRAQISIAHRKTPSPALDLHQYQVTVFKAWLEMQWMVQRLHHKQETAPTGQQFNLKDVLLKFNQLPKQRRVWKRLLYEHENTTLSATDILSGAFQNITRLSGRKVEEDFGKSIEMLTGRNMEVLEHNNFDVSFELDKDDEEAERITSNA